VVERGELLGVVEGRDHRGGIGWQGVGGWWNARQGDLLPEADVRARAASLRIAGMLSVWCRQTISSGSLALPIRREGWSPLGSL
jgi:hypothetical protein